MEFEGINMSMDFDQAQQKNAPVFHGEGIIDVTNFEAMSPDDSLGYMCGCNISIFQDGMIEICSADNEQDILERFSALNIIKANNNINNFDPQYAMGVSVLLENKDLRIFFQTKENKMDFWNALATTYDNLKTR